MKRGIFWWGALFGGGVLLVIELAVMLLGAVNMSADQSAGLLDDIGNAAFESSTWWRAPKTKNPVSQTPDVLREGMEHFKSSCVFCHGAPKVARADWGTAMLPEGPELASKGTQASTDGELFYIIKEGVRMTGMPAFGEEHSDEDIWKIVSFIRHLPELTAGEQAELREAVEGLEHEHEHGEHEHGAEAEHEQGMLPAHGGHTIQTQPAAQPSEHESGEGS